MKPERPCANQKQTECFVSSRIAGRCCTCGARATLVHCPKTVKSLHCEFCCPICTLSEGDKGSQGGLKTPGRPAGDRCGPLAQKSEFEPI